MREPKPRKPGKTGRGPLAPFFQACCARFARTGPSPIACLDNSVLLHIFEDSDTQSSQNEDLKTDIIKSRDKTIAARDAQIAGLQSELDDLRKQLPEAKPKAAELEADLNKTKGDPERPCLELQDALSKQLPPEIHHKMLPASRTIALRLTSNTMRTAVEKADAVVQARR
jgi:hypothetical protein